MKEHCTRTEILAGARTGRLERAAARAHLDTCADCRALWELACRFAGSASARLDPAPSGWVERAVAIGRSTSEVGRLARAIASLVFDSWHAPALAGLRSAGQLDSRRLSWECGAWHIDLRAESTAEGWDLVAQVQREGTAAVGLELQFNSDVVFTDASGLATWHGQRPPRKISLQTPEGALRFESVPWSRPKSS